MSERERESDNCVCASVSVCLCVYVMLVGLQSRAEQSRADGVIMRKQNDSDNDDQIIMLHLKK